MSEQFQGFQNALTSAVVSADQEKTRYDKLVSKEEMFRLRDLLKKSQLSVEDANEIMSIANSTETKLTRLDDHERKILGKYLDCWIANFSTLYLKILAEKNSIDTKKFSERENNLRNDIEKTLTDAFKKSIHAYFFALRTPLSLEGNLIESLSKNREEVEYLGVPGVNPALVNQQWGRGKQ